MLLFVVLELRFFTTEFIVLIFDTHSEVHLAVLDYLRCCQRKTGSYGWSLEVSAFRGPDDSQQHSL